VTPTLDPIAAFANHLPVRIRFGEGAVGALPDVLQGEGARRLFAVLDEVVAGLDPVAAALAAFEAGGGEVVRWLKPAGEPTVDEVDRAGAALRDSGADAVVAIGGGSAMDTAKAARTVAGQGAPWARLAAGEVKVQAPMLPLMTVPSTAGTGSEVSGGAVITDAASGRKAGVASPLQRAQHALVDPELTYGLPPGPTAQSGIDALAQAIAAVVVRVSTPIGDAIGLEAARMAAEALPSVVRDGSDRAARGRMMCASLMAGLAMNISDCGAEHSIGQALGGRHHLPHGLTIGLVLAETMERDREAVPERFERIADALGESAGGPPDGSRAVVAVRRILREIGFPTLRSTGVQEDDVEPLAELAAADPFIAVAPREWSREDARAVFRDALALESR
jgi:choline dehydrogenase